MIRFLSKTPVGTMLENWSQAISERRLIKALETLETSPSADQREEAFRKLSNLLSTDPRALHAYISDQELETQLRNLKSNPSFLAS
jgi:hypothetical protein